jgi:outer membrane protein TolC
MKYSPILPLLFLLLPAGAAHGQEPTEPLTLAGALERARERNPAHRKALNDLPVAAAAERRALGGFLPDLRLSMGFNAYSSRTVTGEDDYGQPIALEDPIEFSRSSSSQGLSMTIPIFAGGRRFAELSAARAETRVARAGVLAELARLDAEVARSYFTAVRYQRQAELEESLLESAAQHLEATRRLLAIAARDPLDLLGAEVEVARQERAVSDARAEATKAVLRLRELMGESGPESHVLADGLPALFDPSVFDLEQLVAAAVAANPGLARLEARETAADRQVSVARSGRWPTVNFNAGYGRSVGLAGTEALWELNPRNSNTSFGLSFSLPLFSQFQTSYQVAQARAGRDDAREDLRAARLLAEREVRAAVLDLQSAYEGAMLADRAASLAADRLEMARERYTLGTLSFTELRDVVDQGAAAEREALAARSRFAEALVALEERVGAPVRSLEPA